MVIWNPWHGCHRISEGCAHCYMYVLDGKRGIDTEGAAQRRRPDRGGALRQCLTIHSFEETECWIIVKRGKPIDPAVFYYLDAVEEALC